MQGNPLHTDQYLLERIAESDTDAFTLLFNRHSDRVYSASLIISKSAVVAEDVVQDVFLKLWENRLHHTNIVNLPDYLFIAVRNTIYKKFKHMKVADAYEHFLRHRISGSPVRSDNFSSAKEMEELINKGITQLSPQQQRAFRLSREQGLDHASIAQEMNISRATVKDYIVRSLAFLRKYLYDNGAFQVILLLYGFHFYKLTLPIL